jgi:hypothetical protein
LLPAQIDRQPTGKYIIDRTMYRPRDVIAFFNCCIHLATDRPEITMHMVRSAEAEYSRLRFRSLADEWHADYPSLLAFADILKKRPRSFQVKDLSLQSLEEKSLEVAVSEPTQSGPLTSMAIDVANGTMDAAEARRRLIKTLYEVGLIGLKLESFTKAAWSFLDVSTIPVPQITDDTTVNICPVFYRVLGIEAGSDKMSSA